MLAVGLLAAASLTLSCATTSTSSAAKKPTAFTFLASSWVGNYDPEGPSSVASGQVRTNLYASWFYFPTSLKNGIYVPDYRAPIPQWQPRLMASWKQDSPVSWTFTIRDGVKSCTGNTMTTDDVLYSFGRAKAFKGNEYQYLVASNVFDPADKSSGLSGEVVAVNKTTFRIQTLKPSQLLPYILADRTHAMVYDSAVMKQHATAADPWSKTWLSGGQAAGYGPYCLGSVDPTAQQTLLTANPSWNWPSPQFKTIIIRNVPDASSRLEAVRRGAADGTLDLSPQQYASLAGGASVYSDSNAQVIYLGMNFKFAPWNLQGNQYLRKAVASVLPYKAIVGGPLTGAAVQMQGIMPPVYTGAIALPQPGNDVAAAKQFLAQAQIAPGDFDKYSQGLTLYYSQASEALLGSVANQIRTALAQIGINIQIQAVPEAQLQSQGLGNHQLPMMLYIGPPGNYPLASSSADIFFKTTGVGNFTNYANPTVDALIAQANSASTADAYNAATKQMQQQMWGDMPVVPICQLKNQIAFRKGYFGWEDYTVATFLYFASIKSS